jgi:hypothetical protein
MTIWQFMTDNKTKILGTLTTVVAGLLSMIALGMFNGSPTEPPLLESFTLRWMTVVLSLLNMVLGGGTIAAGVANTTKERVATAAATVAVAEARTAASMETAIHATPGDPR